MCMHSDQNDLYNCRLKLIENIEISLIKIFVGIINVYWEKNFWYLWLQLYITIIIIIITMLDITEIGKLLVIN